MYTLRDCLRSVGRGWRPLVMAAWKAKPEGVEIIQVKEKFGWLRIYYTPSNDEYRSKISMLERLSSYTCEACGRRGKQSTWGRGWLKTLCDECGERRRNELR